MIGDKLLTFFNKSQLKTSASSEGKLIGIGGFGAAYIPVAFIVDDDAVGAGTITLTFEGSSKENFSSDVVELLKVGPIASTDLKSNFQLPVRILPKTHKDFIRVKVASTGITGGLFTIKVVADLQEWEA